MSNRTRNILIAILFLSVLLRVGASIYLGSKVQDLPGTADQLSYYTLALRVLSGHGFSFGQPWWPATAANAPTAHWSYLYTGFLVFVYALFGPYPLAARLVQAVLVGLLQPFLAYLIGRQVFNNTVGLIAAAITAFYAYFIYYAANLMTESFYICAIMASLYIAIRMVSSAAEASDRAASSRNWKLAVFLGFALLVAVLLRQLFLLFIPFLFLWVGWASRWRRIPELAFSAVILIALILPFTYYNYVRFHQFVLLNTNSGFAFFWGNNPIYGTHFVSILPSQTYGELIPSELRSLNEAAMDQALLRRGIQFVLDDPKRYILLSISRIPAYFMFWSSSESGLLSNISRVASFGILWPFMLYGLIFSILNRSQFADRTRSPVLLLYLFIIVYTGIHLLTWALIRYRLPVDAVLVVFAGLAFADLANRIPALRGVMQSLAASEKYS